MHLLTYNPPTNFVLLRMSESVSTAAENIGSLQRQKWIDPSPWWLKTVACCFNQHLHNEWNVGSCSALRKSGAFYDLASLQLQASALRIWSDEEDIWEFSRRYWGISWTEFAQRENCLKPRKITISDLCRSQTLSDIIFRLSVGASLTILLK